MNEITLYLDMDGVLANFDKAYRAFDPLKEDRKRFRASVMEFKIFEDLEFMPGAKELLSHVDSLDVNIEILTSMGTHDEMQGLEAKRQKIIWLNKHGIKYKPNFSRNKQEKAQYASAKAILVDDSVGCIHPFVYAGGHGILHSNSTDTISMLNTVVGKLKGC